MSRFTDTLSVKESIKNDYFILNEPLIWEWDEIGSGKYIVVPTGFVSDGASVPFDIFGFRWRRTIRRAAILHDYLYYNINRGTPNKYANTRKKADDIFYQALIACGTQKWFAWTLYTVVRIFGRYAIKSSIDQTEV